MHQLLLQVSSTTGIAAAILWAISAYVKTPKSFSVYVSAAEAGGGQVVGYGSSPDLEKLGQALRRQSGFSAAAAISAAIAAVTQAISLRV